MAETNHDGCEQECGGWEEGFADALAGMQEWSITVHDGICRCELCVTGIALIEAALGDMAGILREIRGELKPAEPSDELTAPGPAGGDPRPPAVFINSGAGVGHQAGKEPLAGERSRRSNSQGTGCITRSRVWTIVDCGPWGRITWAFRPKSRRRNPALSAKNSVKLVPRDRQYFHRYL